MTIEDTIKSVLMQDCKNLEYIVVDGGSTDGTLDILAKYQNRIAQYISEPDEGIYHAMNKALRMVTGNIVGFLNADDFYADCNVISEVANVFENSKAGCCYGDLEYVAQKNPKKVVRHWKSCKYHEGLFQKGWHPPHPTFFVRKEIFEKFGGFDTSLTISADYEIMLRFLKKIGIQSVYIPRIMVKMRTGGVSARNLRQIIKANRQCYQAWLKNDLQISPSIMLKKPLSKISQNVKWRPKQIILNSLKQFVKINKQASNRLSITFPAFFSGGGYHAALLDIINSSLNSTKELKSVLEVGGIDRPLLKKQKNIIYDGLDIEEKPACHTIYNNFFVQSVESEITNKYDLVVSITLIEHVKDNVAAMRSIYQALNENGITAHYIPSKYHPYALLLRLVGHSMQRSLISSLRPWASAVTGYPAYFDHCSPISMAKLMKNAGYKNVQTFCFYRASDYFSFFVPLFVIVSLYENMCRLLGLKQLCSGFIVTASK
jgi:glycosyltransferase